MADLKDAKGRVIKVDDYLAVAFSYSHASVGHLRFGTVLGFETKDSEYYPTEEHIWIKWDDPQKKDARIKYAEERFLVLDKP